MKKVQDLVVVKNVEGRDKPVYTNIGIVLTKDDGKQSIKINTVPLEWDGWARIFEQKEKGQSQRVPDEISDVEPF